MTYRLGSLFGLFASILMQWDADAQKQMMRIPVGVREMVVKNTEQAAREKGEEMVSSQFFKDLSAEFGITDELLERFES